MRRKTHYLPNGEMIPNPVPQRSHQPSPSKEEAHPHPPRSPVFEFLARVFQTWWSVPNLGNPVTSGGRK